MAEGRGTAAAADGGNGASKGPQMVQQLKSSFNELVVKEKPNVKWDDVIGLEDAKRAIRESIVFPFERPDLFPLGWPRGMLLYGPPGCGKTILAAATAAEINGYFISIDAASIMSKWLGEAEKNVAKLFTEARKLLEKGDPVIIFIDELDSMLGSRNNEVGGEIRVRNQFLKEMDGIQDKGKHTHLYTIGATNKPWALDWPFLRRFEKRIYVPLPNFEGRISMFKNYTAPINVDPTISLEDLSRISEGYSGSDIRDICQGGQLRVVRELFESGQGARQDGAAEADSHDRLQGDNEVQAPERLSGDAACLRQLDRAVQGPLSRQTFNLLKAPGGAGGALEETSIDTEAIKGMVGQKRPRRRMGARRQAPRRDQLRPPQEQGGDHPGYRRRRRASPRRSSTRCRPCTPRT